MPKLLRYLLSLLICRWEDGDGGGAPVVADVAADPVDSAPAAPAADAGKPASMLDAINQHFDAAEQAGQPRDPQGRFAPKAGDAPAVAAQPVAQAPAVPGQPAQKPAAKPGETVPADDPLAMPEGLQPKAQERFQKLANTNRELQEQVQQRDQALGYVRETFQTHGIQKEQFEQAAQVIGALNRGDLQGALRVLDDQRRQIAVALGQPLPGVDLLQGHEDLRAAVDNMQITEQHAAELARARVIEHSRAQQAQAQRQQQEHQHSEQQAVQAGTQAVDALCKQLQASDLDYAHIEAQLLPVLPQIMAGVPPSRWVQVVKTQYDLIKKVAGGARQSAAPSGGQVLRPTGQASPAAAPKTMFDAMWGAR